MNFKKILAIVLASVLVLANTCFAQNIVTEFENEESLTVKDGISSEITVINDGEATEEEEIFELMEYENGISIIAPATTISEAGGTLQLEAVIWEPQEEESVIWSIEQGSNYASISQTGLVTAKTNGTVVCKVHSTADASKIAYKTIVISIQSGKTQYSVAIMGINSKVIRIQKDKETNLGSHLLMDFNEGTELHLRATPRNDSYEFLYWKDVNEKILSYDPEYTFTVGSTINIYAVCAATSGEHILITFRDMSGKIHTAGSASSEIKVPANPFTLGYSFYCWMNDGKMYDLTPRSVLDTTPFEKSTMFVAAYVKDSTEYTVTATGTNEAGGKYMYNDLVTFTHKAPEDGKRFAYWMRDGKIVSYDAEYKFYVGAFDTSIEAVFAGVNEPVAEVPLVVMSQPQVVDTNKISFVCERYLPEQYTLLSTGIILSPTSPNITIATDGIIHSKAKSTENKGQYTVRKADVTASQVWYAKGYMIYKDGENVITVYSDPVTGKLNM